MTVAVKVKLADGDKCARCFKISTEVDTHTLFASVCERCNTVLCKQMYDVAHGNKKALPFALREYTDEQFVSKFVRKELGVKSYKEAWEKGLQDD